METITEKHNQSQCRKQVPNVVPTHNRYTYNGTLWKRRWDAGEFYFLELSCSSTWLPKQALDKEIPREDVMMLKEEIPQGSRHRQRTTGNSGVLRSGDIVFQ